MPVFCLLPPEQRRLRVVNHSTADCFGFIISTLTTGHDFVSNRPCKSAFFLASISYDRHGSRLLNPIFVVLLNWSPDEFATPQFSPSWYDWGICWLKMSKADSLPVCWKWNFWTSPNFVPLWKAGSTGSPSKFVVGNSLIRLFVEETPLSERASSSSSSSVSGQNGAHCSRGHSYEVRTDGVGRGLRNIKILRTNSTHWLRELRTRRREGVQNSQNFADIICEWSLAPPLFLLVSTRWQSSDRFAIP